MGVDHQIQKLGQPPRWVAQYQDFKRGTMQVDQKTRRCGSFIVLIGLLAIGLLACESRSAKVSRCGEVLWDIQNCKNLWAGDNGKPSGALPTWDDIMPYFLVD